MLLLDTHVWVWSAQGDARRIGSRTRRLLTRGATQGRLHLSPVSLFELAALHTVGRVRFAMPLRRWIDASLGVSGMRIAELTAATAIDAGAIPRQSLPDPLDRLLIATATTVEATLVTADDRILAYATARDDLRVHDART